MEGPGFKPWYHQKNSLSLCLCLLFIFRNSPQNYNTLLLLLLLKKKKWRRRRRRKRNRRSSSRRNNSEFKLLDLLTSCLKTKQNKKTNKPLNSSELITMLQGWKIIQHGWNVKSTFRYSIPKFSPKYCVLWNDLLKSVQWSQEWEWKMCWTMLPEIDFSFSSSVWNASSKDVNGGCWFYCKQRTIFKHYSSCVKDTLDITQLYYLSFPFLHSLKSVWTFRSQRVSP